MKTYTIIPVDIMHIMNKKQTNKTYKQICVFKLCLLHLSKCSFDKMFVNHDISDQIWNRHNSTGYILEIYSFCTNLSNYNLLHFYDSLIVVDIWRIPSCLRTWWGPSRAPHHCYVCVYSSHREPVWTSVPGNGSTRPSNRNYDFPMVLHLMRLQAERKIIQKRMYFVS